MVSLPTQDPTVGIIRRILLQHKMLHFWSTLFTCYLHTELYLRSVVVLNELDQAFIYLVIVSYFANTRKSDGSIAAPECK